jgi:hypothetical protein
MSARTPDEQREFLDYMEAFSNFAFDTDSAAVMADAIVSHDRLKSDAERYRWLKERMPWHTLSTDSMFKRTWVHMTNCEAITLDEMIDQSRASEQRG